MQIMITLFYDEVQWDLVSMVYSEGAPMSVLSVFLANTYTYV
jgi:hypothetical protein